jgi:SAM-dependent methyltransferase/FKBP-type peptidyl-prolyl cis-trans isomerase 2
MTAISNDTLANILFRLHWEEHGVRHEDSFYAQNVNLWRDVFPAGLEKEILGMQAGETRRVGLRPGAHVPVRDMRKVVTVPRKAFRVPAGQAEIEPLQGRFYPQGVLRGVPGVYPQNIQPFRVINMTEDTLTVDLNHPMADLEATLEIDALAVWPKTAEFGGQCRDWVCALTDGPGLKRRDRKGVDFGLDAPLDKPLGGNDAVFYATPRKVAHVDSQARENIAGVFARLLPGRKRILDLMAGWQSHLPDGVTATGLGMNAEEMSENPALSSHVVHDLNADPVLPLADRAFDAVICSLSVEYLTRPLEVFREIARVLEPGGLCVMVFSHRWFPDQAVRIWTELHEFERAGLVMEYFRQSGGFKDLSTLSVRGWPRPMDARDRYYPMIQHSDPVHAVWAVRP